VFLAAASGKKSETWLQALDDVTTGTNALSRMRQSLAAPGAAIDAREQEASSRFTTKYPLLNDLLQETWWLGKGPNNMDTGLAWFASLERFLEWLASRPEAPAASAPAAEVAQPVMDATTLDVCTDPNNCKRCKTAMRHRGNLDHAGIPVGNSFGAAPSSAPAESGWQWVPKEPTPEMCAAWNESGACDLKAEHFEEPPGPDWVKKNATLDWNAMLAAAPQAVQAGGEGGNV